MPGRAEGGAVPPASPGTAENVVGARFGSDPRPAVRSDEFWLGVRTRLMELPQMRPAELAVFGRRPAAPKPRASVPVLGSGRLSGRLSMFPTRLSGIGLPVRISAPDSHDWFIAAALLAFFALGWLAAVASAAS